jgi:hypothetical protein
MLLLSNGTDARTMLVCVLLGVSDRLDVVGTGTVQGKVSLSAYEQATKQNSVEQWHGRENDSGYRSRPVFFLLLFFLLFFLSLWIVAFYLSAFALALFSVLLHARRFLIRTWSAFPHLFKPTSER